MFCPHCGSEISDSAKFCPSCGGTLPGHQAPVGNPVVQAPAHPMKWFKFLIYFALFASAVFSVVNAIIYFTGAAYGSRGEAQMVYAFFPKLKTLDIVVGILYLVEAVLAIVNRFQLAKYRANGPKTLALVYLLSAVISLIYLFGLSSVMRGFGSIWGTAEAASSIGSIITCIIMIFVNNAYFKKRADLFVN